MFLLHMFDRDLADVAPRSDIIGIDGQLDRHGYLRSLSQANDLCGKSLARYIIPRCRACQLPAKKLQIISVAEMAELVVAPLPAGAGPPGQEWPPVDVTHSSTRVPPVLPYRSQ